MNKNNSKTNNKMKKYIAILIIGLFLLPFIGQSQGTKSTYFIEGAPYNHQNNPAFYNDLNYFGIGISNFNIGTKSNIGLKKFIFPYDDPDGNKSLTTFLSPSVSADDFLNGLEDNNFFNFNLSENILGFGFRGFGGFNTFDVNIKSNTYLNLPYDLFNFLKNGANSSEGSEYQMGNLRMMSTNYAEVAFGHSRRFIDKLTVGAKIKVLVGLAAIDANLEQMDISMSVEEWSIESNGYLRVAGTGPEFVTDSENAIENFELNSPGPGGFGAAIDLGASYEVIDGLTVSAAILDLGSIAWSNTISGVTDNEKITFNGFDDIVLASSDETTEGGIGEQGDQLQDDLMNMANFYDDGTVSDFSTSLNPTVNLGAEYVIPYVKQISVGLLFSSQTNEFYTNNETRFFANISASKWFDISANYALTTLGNSYGWVLNFHPKGVNLFLGSDFMVTDVTPQYIPLNNINSNVFFGLNFAIGKRR